MQRLIHRSAVQQHVGVDEIHVVAGGEVLVADVASADDGQTP